MIVMDAGKTLEGLGSLVKERDNLQGRLTEVKARITELCSGLDTPKGESVIVRDGDEYFLVRKSMMYSQVERLVKVDSGDDKA